MTGAGVERLEAEVVENEEIGAAEGFDEARMTPVAACERQVLAQLRPAMIEDGAIVAAAEPGRRSSRRPGREGGEAEVPGAAMTP